MKVSKPTRITSEKYLNLFRVDWFNNTNTGDWIFASRKENPQQGKEKPEADAVIVVPIHITTNINGSFYRRLVVVKEFRIPVGDYEYGFPAGLKLPGEAVIDCAKRELKEETGLQLTVIKHVSPVIYSSTGLSDESVVMVFCECIGETSGMELEPSEELSTHLLDLEQVQKLCKDYNSKQSCKLWPFLYMFSLMGSLELK